MDGGRRELIDTIVRQVVDALRGGGAACGTAQARAGRAGVGAPVAKPAEAPRPSVLVVLTGGTGSMDAVLGGLLQIAAMPVRVDCVLSRAASRVHGRGLVERLAAAEVVEEAAGAAEAFGLVSRSSVVVAPFLTQNTAVKVALGIRDSLASDTLACAFLAGKPVVMVADSLALEYAPPAYRQSILRYVRALESFGARMVKAERLGVEVSGLLMKGPLRGVARGAAAAQAAPPGAGGAGVQLVDLRRAKDLASRLGDGRLLRIGPRAKVTPLAMDYLKERGIAVERVGESGATA